MYQRSTENIKTSRWTTLDAMRGFAAIAVLLLHYHNIVLRKNFDPAHSYLAVDFFFVLSGFVLTHMVEARTSGLRTFHFILKRLTRLYPLYIFGAAIGIFAYSAGVLLHRVSWMGESHFIIFSCLAIFFLPNLYFKNFQLFPFDDPAWSLFFELVINLIFCLVLRYLSRFALLAFTASSAAFLVGSIFIFNTANGGFILSNSILGLTRVAYSFETGMVIYFLRSSILTQIRIPSYIPIVVLYVFLVSPIPNDMSFWYDIIFIIFISPCLVFMGTFAESSGRITLIYSFLGSTSYAIYSIHQPLELVYKAVLEKLIGSSTRHVIALQIVFIGLMLIFGSLVNRYYDIPLRKFLSKKFGV